MKLATPTFLMLIYASYALAAQPTLTELDARKAPLETLVDKTLRGMNGLFVEVARHNAEGGMFGANFPLNNLSFATAPRVAGNPGLCETTVLSVDFKALDRRRNARTPVLPSGVETHEMFKVVGDLSPLPDVWNDKYQKEIASKCARSGSTFSSTKHGDRGYFYLVGLTGNQETNDAWLATRALQLATTIAATSKDTVSCVTDYKDSGCSDPAKLLQGLKLSDLEQVTIRRCEKEKGHICVSGKFFHSAEFNEFRSWNVEVRADAQEDGDHRDIQTIQAINIRDELLIAD